MMKVISSDLEMYKFIYDKKTKKIVEKNSSFIKFLNESSLDEEGFIRKVRVYFSENRGIILENDLSQVTWSFHNEGHNIIAIGYKTLSLNSSQVSVDEIHRGKLVTLGEMTAGIIHDINNPLGFIISNMETLKYEIDNLFDDNIIKEENRDMLAKKLSYIEEGSSRISEIIEGVKMLVHKDEIDFKKEDLFEIFNKAAALSSYKLKQKGVSVKIKKNDDCNFNYQVMCKKSMIYQVIINLLQNSADALEGLPIFKKWIDISFKNDNGYLKVYIKDGGSGVSIDIAEKLFEPFFTTKEIGKGTGLGLSLSKQIMQAHRGDIFLDNESLHTCFVLSFKLD